MSWVTFTAAHVKARMSARELATYEAVSRKEYGDDGEPPAVPADAPERMTEIVRQVCDRFRMSIICNPNVTKLGPDGTLPEGLIYSASVIARDALIALPPVDEGMTNPRQKEHDAAEAELKAVRTMPAAAFAVEESAGSAAAFGGDQVMTF